MNSIFNKSFIFKASTYEVYYNGQCIDKGVTNTTITAIVSNNVVEFTLKGDLRGNTMRVFTLPILGIEAGDILEDRVQYGRLPRFSNGYAPNEPIVCNIFNNMKCIRFAMFHPLRIVEYFGTFECIGENTITTKGYKTEENKDIVGVIKDFFAKLFA